MWPFKDKKMTRKEAMLNPNTLGNMLLKAGAITIKQLETAIIYQDANTDVMLGEALIKTKAVDRDTIHTMLTIQKFKKRKINSKDIESILNISRKESIKTSEVHDLVRASALELIEEAWRVLFISTTKVDNKVRSKYVTY